MAISDYLERLNILREKLADNLQEMGVDASHEETLSVLVPKVLDIPQGGDGVNNLFLSDSAHILKDLPHDISKIWISSDTVLKPELSISDFNADALTAISYVNDLLAEATVDTEKVIKGETITVQAKSSAYLNKNGTSRILRLPVMNTVAVFQNNDLGRKILTSSYNDEGNYTITLEKYHVFPFLTESTSLAESRSEVSSITLNGNSILTAGGMTFYFNNRDNAYKNIYLLEIPMDDVGTMVRVTWDGYMPYNQNESYRSCWQFSFYGNGDAMLYVVSFGSSANKSGTYRLNNTSYTNPGAGGCVSIYRDDYFGTNLRIVNGEYDVSLHNKDSDKPVIERTLETMTEDTSSMTIGKASGADDQTFTLSNSIVPWPYKGTERTTFYVSTNSWIGVTGSSEEIKVNRRDAYGSRLLHAVYHLTDLNLRCYRIRWEGKSQYSGSSIDQIYDWYFFENGDAMLHLVKKGGTQGGTYSFFGSSFSVDEGGYVSFYRTDADSSGWTIENAIYAIEKHVA